MTETPTLALARELVRRRSVTPLDAGCQELLAERLAALGFECERMPFGEVANLWARRGHDAPLLVFAGHTDVVPPGPENRWSQPPFEARVHDGLLYGRGAADMKGAIAAFVTACERFLELHRAPRGSLAMLITSDEEGPSVDGTRRVVDALTRRGERMDWCVVGEPSSEARVGDQVRRGRRGSLNGTLLVRGRQGHVAYAQDAVNPIHGFARALAALDAEVWDAGDENFPATSFQVSNVRAGTGADNVIPGELEAQFNFRYSTAVTREELESRVSALLARHGLDFELEWRHSGAPFLTPSGPLLEAVQGALVEVNGAPAALSTGGGTSDGRFVAPTGAEVVELGPVNATIHRIDEHVAVDELETLSRIYERILERLLA